MSIENSPEWIESVATNKAALLEIEEKITPMVRDVFIKHFGKRWGRPEKIEVIGHAPGPHGSGFIEIGGSLVFRVQYNEFAGADGDPNRI